jgi:translation elongation factor EF-1beta
MDVMVRGADHNLWDVLRKISSEIEMDGLVWGRGAIHCAAYGMKTLVVAAFIEDEKVGIADVKNSILGMKDLVQSVTQVYREGGLP